MAASENKGTKARKPQGNLEGIKVAQGLEEESRTKAEVSGHASSRAYHCWACWALNYVPGGYDYFICWRCGALNWI